MRSPSAATKSCSWALTAAREKPRRSERAARSAACHQAESPSSAPMLLSPEACLQHASWALHASRSSRANAASRRISASAFWRNAAAAHSPQFCRHTRSWALTLRAFLAARASPGGTLPAAPPRVAFRRLGWLPAAQRSIHAYQASNECRCPPPPHSLSWLADRAAILLALRTSHWRALPSAEAEEVAHGPGNRASMAAACSMRPPPPPPPPPSLSLGEKSTSEAASVVDVSSPLLPLLPAPSSPPGGSGKAAVACARCPNSGAVRTHSSCMRRMRQP